MQQSLIRMKISALVWSCKQSIFVQEHHFSGFGTKASSIDSALSAGWPPASLPSVDEEVKNQVRNAFNNQCVVTGVEYEKPEKKEKEKETGKDANVKVAHIIPKAHAFTCLADSASISWFFV